MPFLTVPSNESVEGYPPQDPAISYSFSLDPFQQQAVLAIHRGDNVLVTAKTGSGKTMIGEYQIAYSLRLGKRVFYTTPIKSLSNQKYHDLKKLFPAASVGIMTGDIKSNPEADIVVMTTEILRNLLFKQSTSTVHLGTAGQISLDNLGAVVFDEVHYINDVDRGHVWEETLILLDPSVKLILLSATIDAPEAFASWLGQAKQRPIVLLKTSHRVVPLIHGLFDAGVSGVPMRILKDGDEAPFLAGSYTDWLKGREARTKASEDWAKKVLGAKAAGVSAGGMEGKVKLHSFTHSMNECVSVLKDRDLLPALFFVLSRKDCERYAEQVQGSLIDSSETAAAKHIISFHLHRYLATLEHLAQYHQIVRLLERGIAFHHSGLLPLLKEIVELLFSRGFVKVLFCTETFAVGLNMPARTVVFLDLKKPAGDGGGFRPLRSDEYIQMAGRAGRRGKDTRGIVLYLPARHPVEPDELRTTLTGPLVPLTSRLQFHYDFILKALHSQSPSLWSTVIDASYWEAQRSIHCKELEKEIAYCLERRGSLNITAEQRAEMDTLRSLETQVKTTANSKRRKAQMDLERWKTDHTGASWKNVVALYESYERITAQINSCQLDIQRLSGSVENERVKPILGALTSWGALDKTLTPFGICATEINEGNPLLIAKLYETGLLKDASAQEIVGVLGAFIVDREAQEKTVHPMSLGPSISDLVKRVLVQVDEWGQEGVRIDSMHRIDSPEGFWSLATLWTEIGTLWYLGETASAITGRFDIYEGNLMRGLLKLAALVNEWTSVATYKADVDMLDKCKEIGLGLLRDIAQPESLYLRL